LILINSRSSAMVSETDVCLRVTKRSTGHFPLLVSVVLRYVAHGGDELCETEADGPNL